MRGWCEGTLLAAALMALSPGGAVAGGLSAEANGIRVELRSQPEQPRSGGKTTYTLRLMDAAGGPVTGARVMLTGRMADGMAVVAPLRGREPGTYRGEVLFTMAGPWELTLRIARQSKRFELPLTEHVAR